MGAFALCCYCLNDFTKHMSRQNPKLRIRVYAHTLEDMIQDIQASSSYSHSTHLKPQLVRRASSQKATPGF